MKGRAHCSFLVLSRIGFRIALIEIASDHDEMAIGRSRGYGLCKIVLYVLIWRGVRCTELQEANSIDCLSIYRLGSTILVWYVYVENRDGRLAKRESFLLYVGGRIDRDLSILRVKMGCGCAE